MSTINWQSVPGALKHVATGGKHIWGVNFQDKIFRYKNGQWHEMPGLLSQLDVAGDGSVWGVNAQDEVFRWAGHAWERKPGALRQISVGSSKFIVGCNAQQQIWAWNGDKWQQLPGAAVCAAVNASGDIWVVNVNGEIFHWRDNNWVKIDGLLKNISVADDGTIMGTNRSDEVWWRQGEAGSWQKQPGLLAQVSVHKWPKHVWGVNSQQQVWVNNGPKFSTKNRVSKLARTRRGFASVNWKQMPGKLRQAAVSKYGIYGVNAQQEIFKWNGFSWDKLPGLATHISVGSDGAVWCCNASDEIFRWNFSASNWEKMPGLLRQLSVAHSNSVLGVNAHQDIFHWNGSQWNQLPGKAVWAAANKKNEWWVVNFAGEVFFWANGTWQKIDGQLNTIDVTTDGTIIGTNAQHNIWTRDGPSGTWHQLPGAAVQVAAYNKKNLVCVNVNQDIFTM